MPAHIADPNRPNPMPATQASSLPNPNPYAAAEDASNLMIEATPEARRGAYADFASVRVNGGNSMIDFLLVDSVGPEGGSGVLTSRVVMSNESLLALRDMLNEVTADWTVAGQ